MKKYIFNILLIFLTAIFAVSCCFIPSTTIRRTEEPEDDIKTEEAVVIERPADQGTFTGFPRSQKISSILISGQAIDADISGNYAYVTNDLGALYIINISDRERPYVTGKCRDIDSANIVIVKGDYAYVSYTEWIAGETDYYTECGFKIVNISDKEDPEVIGDYISGDDKRKTVFGLYIEGDYAYLNTSTFENGTETNSLEIVDISRKDAPELVGGLELEGSPANIYVDSNTAYINVNYYDYTLDDYTDNSELLLIDISDKKAPSLKTALDVPANSWGIYYSDGKVYLSSNRSSDDNYSESMVQIVDVSGEEPLAMGSIGLPGGSWELDMTGGFLYVADLTGGIYTIDVLDSNEPFIASRLNTSGTSYDITLMGNYGYISDGFEGLVIMELSDEESSEEYKSAGKNQENLPPQAVVDVYGDINGDYYVLGTPVLFSAVNSFDPESEDIEYAWIIGEEEYHDESMIDLVFGEPGSYEIVLEISDGVHTDRVIEYIQVADINEPVSGAFQHDFIVEIEYILENLGQDTLKEIECLMRVPLNYEPYQYINKMETNFPIVDEIYDNHRNKLLKFEIDEELEPGEQLSVIATFDVTINEFDYSDINQDLFYDEDDPDLYYYTRDDLFIDSDSPLIVDITQDLVGNETRPLAIAGILYDYVIGNLYYDWDRAENREYEFMSASEILETGSGVCADYSILYTAMLRAAGIPARLAAGIPVYTMLYETDQEIDIGHAWVEIKIPGYGWVPVDITTEEDFWTSNYFLDITTERGPGYIYEHTTMDWGSYFYDGFDYTRDGEGIPLVEQSFIFRARDISLSDITKD